MKNFTFKKHSREAGLATEASQGLIVDIKHNKLKVGAINPPSRFAGRDGWTIQLAVVDASDKKGWKYVFFKQEFEEEGEARNWLKEQKDLIFHKYTLHYFED